jgi:gamma-glutamyltranspeptidase / glutathione hydrolase / leukotriene-C4 hydrolase
MKDLLSTDASATLDGLPYWLAKSRRLDIQYGIGALPLYSHHRKPLSQTWRIVLIVMALLSALCLLAREAIRFVIGGHAKQYFGTLPRNPAYLVEALHGAVASENERCSIMGVNILKGGGNAVDAAVAAAFCIGVVNMFS